MTDRNGNQTTLNYTNGILTGITDAFGRTLSVSISNGLITQISDNLGVVATYQYFTSTNNLQEVTYSDGSKYKFEYTTINNKTYLTTVKDAYNNILETHQYDSSGRATTSEVEGGVDKYTLDYSNSTYTQVTDGLGRITKYYYKTDKSQNYVTKIEGNCNCGGGSEITEYEYDGFLNVKKKTDANGHITTSTFDANSNKLSQTDPTGTQSWTYNSFGQVLTAKDQMNGTTTVIYNTNGNPTSLTDALNNSTNFTYNTNGQILTLTDARNKTTTFTWTNANLTKVKDANNKETNFVYDTRGRLTSQTNALNHATNYEYDTRNRLKKVIYPDTKFEEFTYDLAGRRTQAKDARGNITNYVYDGAYRLTSVTDALNHTLTYGYDLMSNRTAQTDALGNVTNYEYDSFDRLKKIKYPAITTGGTRLEEMLDYDDVGNLITKTDTAGRLTHYEYDTADRLIKITDANNQLTQFEYNARSQMTKVKDAINQEYVFAYDALGRQLSQTRASATMSFEYDAVGNRTKRTDYLARVTHYQYDNLNRLTKIKYGDTLPVGQPPNLEANYSYDDLSRLISASNENGTVSFTYDNRNRIKTTTDVYNHLIEYSYDGNSNRTQLKLDGNVHTNYVYDVANRLTSLTDATDNTTVTFGYDNANRLTTKTLPNNVVTNYNYDGMSRLTRLQDMSSTATLFDRQYSYNNANQINQIAEPTNTRSFGYDNLNRLTSMTNGTSNENYSFDNVGNRTSSHLSNTYTYQPNNKMTATQTATMNYDTNGNLIKKSEGSSLWRYGWDYENRMTFAKNRRERVNYVYDALGRRVRTSNFLKGSTKYTYDGLDVIQDDDSNTGITKYQNGLGIDNKLKLKNGSNSSYFLADHLGSTNGLVNSSGNLTSSASYDSFGNKTGNLNTRYQFTGREKDDVTGLYYYRARWYDSKLGRFISEDPIGFAGGDVNLYGYVGNNPILYNDPFGFERYSSLERNYYF